MPFDIMMPFYGDVGHMQLAVRSILAQDDDDWRVVVVDDGYPDESIPGWFESLGDPRVVYRRNAENLGANANYRLCLDLVESPWFVMMGADDVLLPNYVSRMKELGKTYPDAGLLHPGVRVIDELGRPSRTLVERAKDFYRPSTAHGVVVATGEKIVTNLVRGDWMYFPGICWNAQAARRVGFTAGLDVVQDLALALDVLESGHALVLDDVVSFEYRRHSQSDSSWRALEGTRFLEQGDFFRSRAQHYRAKGWRHAARAADLHLSSRLHALSLVPKAVAGRQWTGVRNLGRHAFS